MDTETLRPVSQAFRRRRAGLGRVYLKALLVFGLLYGITAQRGVSWQDGGVFQWRILQFDLAGSIGRLALAHPTLMVLGKVFSWLPVGPPAWRLNLVSAVFGAVAVANVVLLVRRLCPRRAAAAWVAGGLLGLTHTTWWLATMCECQTIYLALFTLELNLLFSLVRRPGVPAAAGLGLVSGLAWSTHNFALLALPAYGVLLLSLCAAGRLRARGLAAAAGCWVLGAGILLALIAREAGEVGAVAAMRSALFGPFQDAVLATRGRNAAMGVGYVLYNFPNLGLPLMFLGLWSLRGKVPTAFAWALVYLTIAYGVFALRYNVPDQFSFFLPVYALVAILAGLGIGRLRRRRRTVRWVTGLAAASVLWTPAVYCAAPAIWRAANLPLPGRKDLPYRDPVSYWVQPWKHAENSAERFAREALATVPAGGIILADSTSVEALRWTQQVDGVGPDVTVQLGYRGPPEALMAAKNVYTVAAMKGYCPSWILERARLVRENGQVLYRVIWPGPDTTPGGAGAERPE